MILRMGYSSSVGYLLMKQKWDVDLIQWVLDKAAAWVVVDSKTIAPAIYLVFVFIILQSNCSERCHGGLIQRHTLLHQAFLQKAYNSSSHLPLLCHGPAPPRIMCAGLGFLPYTQHRQVRESAKGHH